MKKMFVGFFIAAILFACGGDDKKGGTTQAAANDNAAEADKGLDVLVKYDCATCHKIEEKIQGPAYRDVANKYAGQADAVAYLSGKIIKGGTGVWGDIAMLPHPNVPQEDAEAIAKYILSLKNK
jgi:cytochrome c